MRVIHTIKYAMYRRLAWAVVLGFLLFVIYSADLFAQNKPDTVPQHVIDQGHDTVVVYKGPCPDHPTTNCVIGVHASGNYALALRFNQYNVLVEILRLEDDKSPQLLWRHRDYTV